MRSDNKKHICGVSFTYKDFLRSTDKKTNVSRVIIFSHESWRKFMKKILFLWISNTENLLRSTDKKNIYVEYHLRTMIFWDRRLKKTNLSSVIIFSHES